MNGVGFERFNVQLSRFTDREINSHLNGQKKTFFNRAGGSIRKTSKRSLRRAPQKKLSELTTDERVKFRIQQDNYKAGKRKTKPRRPERKAARRKPPLLHMKKSPLRELIFYFTDQNGESIVIGPSQFKNGNLQYLEQNFPFMEPALQIITPKFPEYLAAARRSYTKA